MDRDQYPPIVHLQATAGKVGFPERNGPLIYVPTCNMRCPYCLNTDIVLNRIERRISVEDVEEHMFRHNESFIFISGGEPCMHKSLSNLVRRLSEGGIKVGVSTNGTYPDRIKDLVVEAGVDFVAMDIKSDPDKPHKWGGLWDGLDEFKSVKETIRVLNELLDARRESGFGVEFRTTAFPPLVDIDDVSSISKAINPKSVYVIQQFRPRAGLLGGEKAETVEPYADEMLYKMLEAAKANVPMSRLRWP